MKQPISAKKSNRIMRQRRLRTVSILCACLLTVLAYQINDTYRYSLRSDTQPADAAVVLGAATWNGEPSPVFAERIRHAVDLYQTGQVRKIIFTGGVDSGEELAEALIAAQYAQRQGVPAEDLYCDTVSSVTWENLVNAQAITQSYGLRRVLLVSDPIHMRRAMAMAEDMGLAAAPSPTRTSRYQSWWSQLQFLIRESAFYGLHELLFGLGLMHPQPPDPLDPACTLVRADPGTLAQPGHV